MCAFLLLQVPEAEVEKAQKAVAATSAHLQEQFRLKETSLAVSLGDAKSTPSEVLTANSAERLISLLLVAPHGVAKMSHAVEGGELAFDRLHCTSFFSAAKGLLADLKLLRSVHAAAMNTYARDAECQTFLDRIQQSMNLLVAACLQQATDNAL